MMRCALLPHSTEVSPYPPTKDHQVRNVMLLDMLCRLYVWYAHAVSAS